MYISTYSEPRRDEHGRIISDRQLPSNTSISGSGSDRWDSKDNRGSDKWGSRNNSNARFSRNDDSRSQQGWNNRNDNRQHQQQQQQDNRPAHLKFSRGITNDNTSRNNNTEQQQQQQQQQALDDSTSRLSLNDRRSSHDESSLLSSAQQPSLEPVKLGKDSGLSLAERMAARKQQREQEAQYNDAPTRTGNTYSDRIGRSSRDNNYNNNDQRERPASSGRFARPADEGSRYGDDREGSDRGTGRSSRGGRGGYLENRERIMQERDRYGGSSGSRHVDITQLPTKPMSHLNYEQEQEAAAAASQPKKLEAAKAQKEIKADELEKRYDTSAVKLDVVEKNKTVNKLQNAIDNKQSIKIDDLNNNVNTIDLSKHNNELADVIVRSIIDNSIQFNDVINSIQKHITDNNQSKQLILTIITKYQERRDENKLLELINNSNIDILSIIAPNLSGNELDNYLEQHNLLRLKPVVDITEPIQQELSNNESPINVLSIIDKNLDSRQSASSVRSIIASHVSKLIYSKTGAYKADILSEWLPVLKRTVLKNKDEQVQLVRELVQGWFTAGFAKNQLRESFINVYDNNVISASSFKQWQEDIKDRSSAKMKALMQTNTWLAELPVDNRNDNNDHDNDSDDDIPTNPNLDD